MSALSCCVTCGIAFHACAEVLGGLAADVAHRLALDLAPLGEVGQRRRRDAAPDEAACRTAPDITCRTKPCTSSMVMRPPGTGAGTWRMSTPSSRAMRRTDGRRRPTGTASRRRCGAGPATRLMSTIRPGRPPPLPAGDATLAPAPAPPPWPGCRRRGRFRARSGLASDVPAG